MEPKPRNQEVVREAEELFRRTSEIHSLRDAYGAADCCATSDRGDMIAVVWNHLYHRGRAPRSIHRSRGHSLRVTPSYGPEEICYVDDPLDHREGIRIA